MNGTVYVFGRLSSGYSQYPDDIKQSLFKSVADAINTKSTIAIRRDGGLVYYVYTKKLHSDKGELQYIGIAIEFNDVYCDDFSGLFALFDEALTKIVLTGRIVEFNDNGEIVAKSSKLHYERSEVERITTSLFYALEALPPTSFKKIPPVNYSIGLNEGTRLTDTSNPIETASALKTYNIVNVYRTKDLDSNPLGGYSLRIKKLNDQVELLSKDNATLSINIAKVKRQKKRTTVVAILVCIISIVIVISIVIGANLSERVKFLSGKIQEMETEIENKDKTIQLKSVTISEYVAENKQIKDEIAKTRKALSSANSEIQSLQKSNSTLSSQKTSLQTRIKDLESKLKQCQNRSSSSSTSQYYSNTSQSNPKMSISHDRVSIRVKGTIQLSVTNAGQNVVWESDSPAIATVSSSGVVKGVKKGVVRIWAKGREYKSCLVEVR